MSLLSAYLSDTHLLTGYLHSPLQPERSHLLNSDDPYNASGYGYGSTSQGLAPPRHILNPEDVKREQEALEGITRWTTE